jgi:tetratricopeptide (TPR) repeat protein
MDLAPPSSAPSPLPSGLRAAIQAARGAGEHERALALLAQAIAAKPEAAWPRIETIGVLRELGEKDKARAAIDALLAEHPTNAKAWVHLGLLERSNGSTQAALTAFEQAHQCDPILVEPVLQMAQEHFTLGHQQRSDALLQDALALDTDGIQALTQCAQRAMMANDPRTALPLFEQAIARTPWHVPSYVGACNAQVKLGQIDAAMATLDTGLEQCGSRPALHARRVHLLRDLGFYRAALDIGTQSLAQHEDSFPLWEAVMRLHIMIGDADAMRDFLAQAHPTRDSERATVATLAGDMAAELGDPDTAVDCYQRASEIQPGASRMHGALAVAHLTRFDVGSAAIHLERQVAMTAPALRLKNKSDNPQQSYYGQIINEYRLDTEAVALVASLPPTPRDRAAALRSHCRNRPDSTLLASALLDALWRGNDLAPCTSPAALTIPTHITQYWDAAPPPADVAGIMQSWPDRNPDFTHRPFDDLAARDFLHTRHYPQVLQAYHRATSPAMQADLFRLAYLACEGGIYADADDRCTTSLAPLLPPGAELVLYREYLGTLGNNFMAAIPRHPVILAALEGAVRAINRGDQEIIWLATGPGLITRAFAAVLSAEDENARQTLATTRVWSRRETLRHVSIHCLAGYKDTAQHWVRAAFTTTQRSAG